MATSNPLTTDRQKLDNLFSFAADLLTARTKSQLRFDQHKGKLGSFEELDLLGLPGVKLDSSSLGLADGTWLSIQRLRKSEPPLPHDQYLVWLDTNTIKNPTKQPEFNPIIVDEILESEALLLVDEAKLQLDQIEYLVSDDDEKNSLPANESKGANENEEETDTDRLVRVSLYLKDDTDAQTNLNVWREQTWKEWAVKEAPVRRSIALYQKLFKLHTLMHSGDSSANEIVWGVGIAEYGSSSKKANMPLIEFLIDLNLDGL